MFWKNINDEIKDSPGKQEGDGNYEDSRGGRVQRDTDQNDDDDDADHDDDDDDADYDHEHEVEDDDDDKAEDDDDQLMLIYWPKGWQHLKGNLTW